ncbi:BON domain-containing protein [Frigoribacterium sp. VKM Ac-2530]|uniref:BON domain-containing protein n=1 Tax=Frigoribacterium sp. VKM Ac-2530 TaxID=2783822 RepID=UPI001889EE60|nr:BON domain-containing protein [Frigoribacterium sp. VKM Ac-2530]MBF4578434.1 BON domain-containing protein [Frigoribacterium sp. VKM Ac-2530]
MTTTRVPSAFPDSCPVLAGEEAARRVRRALRRWRGFPVDAVEVEVEEGGTRVVVSGTVEWSHQVTGARLVVADVPGVPRVVVHLDIARPRADSDAERAVRHALVAEALSRAEHIHVAVDGEGTASTWGHVRSFTERHEVEALVRILPGVDRIDSDLEVRPD